MRVLLLSAYDARSHQQWHQSLRDGLSDWHWDLLTLPARHFSWRVRGNALYWSREAGELLQHDYDLVLATSMVDLAALRGLVPQLASCPNILYFHENQFAYPREREQKGLLEAQVTSIYSALAAGALLFNSEYNRRSFLAGCDGLLRRMPDCVPAGLVDLLAAKSSVLPVPVDITAPAARTESAAELQIVWNHRWEYDKGPGRLLEIAEGLVNAGVGFRMHVVGQQFRDQPESFEALRQCLEQAGALGQWGYLAERSDYAALLSRCDLVLSTADHDFQGLAVLEGCILGCAPLVPDSLVYPEWFPETFRYADSDAAVSAILRYGRMKAAGEGLPRFDAGDFQSTRLIPRYRAFLHSQLQPNSVS